VGSFSKNATRVSVAAEERGKKKEKKKKRGERGEGEKGVLIKYEVRSTSPGKPGKKGGGRERAGVIPTRHNIRIGKKKKGGRGNSAPLPVFKDVQKKNALSLIHLLKRERGGEKGKKGRRGVERLRPTAVEPYLGDIS